MTKECTGIIIGKWKITETTGWSFPLKDSVLEIFLNGRGKISFYVFEAVIDGEIGNFQVGDFFDFSFDGEWECDHCFGKGDLEIVSSTKLKGTLDLYDGDEIEFVAEKV